MKGITHSINEKYKKLFEEQKKFLQSQINENNDSDFSSISLLPISMRIASSTISSDLISVNPMMFIDEEKIKRDVLQENRNRKINSIVENKDYEEMEIKDHPDYKNGSSPSPNLYYLDYVYGTNSNNSTQSI